MACACVVLARPPACLPAGDCGIYCSSGSSSSSSSVLLRAIRPLPWVRVVLAFPLAYLPACLRLRFGFAFGSSNSSRSIPGTAFSVHNATTTLCVCLHGLRACTRVFFCSSSSRSSRSSILSFLRNTTAHIVRVWCLLACACVSYLVQQ